jgi:hypothetical protein
MTELDQLDDVQELTWERLPACTFLCGRAGTGKSTLIRQRVEDDSTYGVIGASTGVAAVNVGCTTINSLLAFFDTRSLRDAFLQGHLTRKLHALAKKHRRLIVEEVSMLDGAQLDILYRALAEANRYAGTEPMGLMLVGDFAQLPPVNASWAFEAGCWSKFAANTERLERIWRQDDQAFVDALNHARAGDGAAAAGILDKLGVVWHSQRDLDFDGTTIVPKNDMVNRHNAMVLDKIKYAPVSLPSERWGQQRSEWGMSTRTREWGIPPAVTLKEGAYVMCLANARELRYANGDCGYCIGWDESRGTVDVELVRTGKVETIEPVVRDVIVYDQQRTGFRIADETDPRYLPEPHRRGDKYIVGQIRYSPVRLAWATTIHKSQSLSLDSVQCDFRDKFFSSAGFLYVALSRCRTLQGLRLVGSREQFIKACRADARVKEWL